MKTIRDLMNTIKAVEENVQVVLETNGQEFTGFTNYIVDGVWCLLRDDAIENIEKNRLENFILIECEDRSYHNRNIYKAPYDIVADMGLMVYTKASDWDDDFSNLLEVEDIRVEADKIIIVSEQVEEADRVSDKMTDLLGRDVWEVLKFNLDMYEYRLRIISDSEFGLTDMQYDEEDERIISKMELLKFFIDDIENRIYVLPVEDSKPHKKDLSILREAIAIEEIEIHRTRATRLEKHMTNKTVAKILDEWLDMQSYTVYIDEFGQLYYIDEIKANNKDRAEHIQAISLHDIVKLIINEIETAILDATLNEIYDDEEIEELYRRDLRILKAYARW